MSLDSLDFREDGRKNEQLRRIEIEHGKVGTNGCITLRQGNSCVRVICDGPKEGNRVLFHVKFSKTSRQEPISEKRVYEYEDILSKIFNTAIIADNQLDIMVEVIQEDGSLISTMVNCIFMCLCFSGIPLIDSVSSVTVSERFVDLSGSEESGRSAILVVVYYINKKEVLYVRSTGRILKDKFHSLLEKSKVAINELFLYFKDYLLKINPIKHEIVSR